MATNLKVCSVAEDLQKKLKKFRFRKEKNNAAIVMKIDQESMTIVEDDAIDEDEVTDVSPEELVEALPAHNPRYVAYSYCFTHDDGRISYPLIFIYFSPLGCKTELQMMYAGSKLGLVGEGGFTKVFEIRDFEEFTEDWLREKLKFFR